jgi:hypothetical protein
MVTIPSGITPRTEVPGVRSSKRVTGELQIYI